MKLLGIDFGLKKIGLAISEGELAEPLMVIRNHSFLTKKIKAICQKHKVGQIVIGLPEGKMAKKTCLFGQKLSQKLRLPVFFQEETLTTKEAIAKMVEAGRGKKYRREQEDAFAAALILQEYLSRCSKT